MNRVYLISGGNMGNRAAMLQAAAEMVSDCGRLLSKSGVYETEAWGMEGAPAFYNQVLCMETELGPDELMNACMEIERKMGRERNTTEQYQSRTLDIDILFFNAEVISTERLVVPHPRLHLRRFVLVPLNELIPDFVHPLLNKSLRQLLAECPDNSFVKQAEV